MTYKRRYLNQPTMYIPIIQCGYCRVDLATEVDGLRCPECGVFFADITEGDVLEEPDWEQEEIVPDLWLTRGRPLPFDAQIRYKEVPDVNWPYALTINGNLVNLHQSLETVEQEIMKLRNAIREHYALQDRKRKENTR